MAGILNVLQDDIDLEVFLRRDTGFGYDAGIGSNGAVWEQYYHYQLSG